MHNYEYIIAGLPVLDADARKAEAAGTAALMEEIREQLCPSDRKVLDFLIDSYDPDKLTEEFYRKALSHPRRFIRDYFTFDLQLRNAKTAWLNSSLGRPEGQDEIRLEGMEDAVFECEAEAEEVLGGSDILKRERGLDDLVWRKVEELTCMDVFDLELILAFTVKLRIIERWLRLDPESGRGLFRKLVSEIRSTYDNKKNKTV